MLVYRRSAAHHFRVRKASVDRRLQVRLSAGCTLTCNTLTCKMLSCWCALLKQTLCMCLHGCRESGCTAILLLQVYQHVGAYRTGPSKQLHLVTELKHEPEQLGQQVRSTDRTVSNYDLCVTTTISYAYLCCHLIFTIAPGHPSSSVLE